MSPLVLVGMCTGSTAPNMPPAVRNSTPRSASSAVATFLMPLRTILAGFCFVYLFALRPFGTPVVHGSATTRMPSPQQESPGAEARPAV